MRRALVVFNPNAAGVSHGTRDVIVRALGSELKLEVAETKRRGHATHIAQGAAHDGTDVVVVFGGDGTLNEVVNGVAGSDVEVVPIPGGGTNVFARTMGYPKDPIEATAIALERLQERAEPRKINLGRVNGRHFAFCCGLGIDAAVVRAVERRSAVKKTIGEAFFVYSALRQLFFAYPRRDAPMTISGPEDIDAVRSMFVCNSDPFTFWGARGFRLCPDADPSSHLDVTAVTTMATARLLRIAWRAFGSGGHLKLPYVHALHNVESLTVSCTRPVPYQVDGEFAGEADGFVFESVPQALSVVTAT
ncbi:MAG: diacylglycerol kinase family protein [Actinomycetota bacterium]